MFTVLIMASIIAALFLVLAYLLFGDSILKFGKAMKNRLVRSLGSGLKKRSPALRNAGGMLLVFVLAGATLALGYFAWDWISTASPVVPTTTSVAAATTPTPTAPTLVPPKTTTTSDDSTSFSHGDSLLILGFVVMILAAFVKHAIKNQMSDKDREKWLLRIKDSLRFSAATILWLTIMGTCWLMSEKYPEPWKFLWDSNKSLTLTTIGLTMLWSSLRYFAKKDKDGGKINQPINWSAHGVALIALAFWGASFYETSWVTSKVQALTNRPKAAAPVLTAAVSTSSTRVYDLTATNDSWTAPMVIPSGYRFGVQTTGACDVTTTFRGATGSAHLTKEGGGIIGDADSLSFRADQNGPPTILVRITLTKI